MRISVFGIGYVGAVSCGCLAALGHEVIGVDAAPEKVKLLAEGWSPIVEARVGEMIAEGTRGGRLSATLDVTEAVRASEVSIICVGTPSAPDGNVTLQAVERVSRDIGHAMRVKTGGVHTVVMRSTVPPGTAEERVIPILEHGSGRKLGHGLAYYSNPEFLREGSAVSDFLHPPFTIVGAPTGDEAYALRELYTTISAPLHVTPFKVAESVKILCNAFHSVKLAFANEAGGILSAYGVDAREAFRLICEDTQLNISTAYLRPGFAFGGSCLPKDMRALMALARQKSLVTPFFGGILPSNEAIIERAVSIIIAGGRRPVGLVGLAFKAGTDDLRESPFVAIAERLLGKGYPLRIFDRQVDVARLQGSNRDYIEREIPHLEALLVPSVAEVVSGASTVVIGHVSSADSLALLQAIHEDVDVLDLAGIPEISAASYFALPGSLLVIDADALSSTSLIRRMR